MSASKQYKMSVCPSSNKEQRQLSHLIDNLERKKNSSRHEQHLGNNYCQCLGDFIIVLNKKKFSINLNI